METYEFQGKNTDEAIENACSQLHVTTDEMDIEIIEPGSTGIFGLVGSRKAKIKVAITKREAASPEQENGLAVAKKALEDILALIPIEQATITAEHTDSRIVLNIEGDTSGLLIGRKGRTLDALQFIVNRIANKSLEKRVRVVIDSENYRQRRQDSLIQISLRMGEKAKKIGKPMTTNLLNPHERRIVHLALREDEELNTKSVGKDGILKKVAIIPKKHNSSRPTGLQ